MEKEILRSIVVVPILLLLGCAQTVKSDQMVRWIQLNESNGRFTCSLYSDKGNLLDKKEGKKIAEVTENLLDDAASPAALGLLDAAVIPDSVSYPQLVEFASALGNYSEHTPNIRFYVSGNEAPEQIAEILDEGNLANCDISRILFDNGGVLVPCLDNRGALACTRRSFEMIQGDNAAVALLLAGEEKHLDLREHGFYSEWATCGMEMQDEGAFIQIECIGCRQKKTALPTSQEEIASSAEKIIRRVGPEPFLLTEKWLQISGSTPDEPMPFRCIATICG